MTTYQYPTAFSHWGDEERDAIQRVLTSGRLTMGPETEAFEDELASFNQRKHAVCVNSGSSANLIAVAALNTNNILGGSVDVPALAWATTYAPLTQNQCLLRLRDCDETWNVNNVTQDWPRPNTLIACSILGNPSNFLSFKDYTEEVGATLINDNCESFGAEIGGRPTGAYGDVATLSFFYSHQLSAIEGGAVLTDDDELALTCRMLRDHGATRSVKKATRFEDEYDFRLFGYNVRPAEINMAVAREQLKKTGLHRTARTQNYRAFQKATTGLPIKFATELPGAVINPFGVHFELEDAAKRSELVQALRASGVDCRLPTGGSFRLHEYGKSWRDQPTPNADRIHRAGLFLGNAPYPMPGLIETAIEVMKEVLE